MVGQTRNVAMLQRHPTLVDPLQLGNIWQPRNFFSPCFNYFLFSRTFFRFFMDILLYGSNDRRINLILLFFTHISLYLCMLRATQGTFGSILTKA
jgi:hypothetical protein